MKFKDLSLDRKIAVVVALAAFAGAVLFGCLMLDRALSPYAFLDSG